MRKVLSTTAGATFHNETSYMTLCVRKDYIELIFKIDRGVYIIINIAHVTPEKVVLFTNWGTYFDRLQNLPVQMPRIKANCPTLYAVLTGDDPQILTGPLPGGAKAASVSFRVITDPAEIRRKTEEVLRAKGRDVFGVR